MSEAVKNLGRLSHESLQSPGRTMSGVQIARIQPKRGMLIDVETPLDPAPPAPVPSELIEPVEPVSAFSVPPPPFVMPNSRHPEAETTARSKSTRATERTDIISSLAKWHVVTGECSCEMITDSRENEHVNGGRTSRISRGYVTDDKAWFVWVYGCPWRRSSFLTSRSRPAMR